MNMKNLAIALAIGIASVGPVAAQNPKPSVTKPADAQRIADLEARIADTTADLEYIRKTVTDKTELAKQEALLLQKIKNFEGQLATYKKVKLPELPSTNPGAGEPGGVTGDPSKPKIADAIWQATGKSLSEDQVKLYSKTKANVLRRLPPGHVFAMKRDLGLADDQPLNADTVPDDKFIKFLRFYFDQYYNFAAASGDKIETIGSYEFRGKKFEVTGLRVIKRRNGELMYPVPYLGTAPEVWPILFEKR